MNGAEALVETLAANGIRVCFANPGTSELHLVAALDSRQSMRAVLGLFEGVVTGAADGYARMSGLPAATLLHLGPGFANGWANLHNARRARSPIVNIVGDHADSHRKLDAPLTSDIAAIAWATSQWVRSSNSATDLPKAGAEAVEAALRHPHGVATLIVPADHAWGESQGSIVSQRRPEPQRASDATISATASFVNDAGNNDIIFLGGTALTEGALVQAGRIASRTGMRLVCETFPARLSRGAGQVPVERLPYFAEMAAEALRTARRMLLVGTGAPVPFFAYPGRSSDILPSDVTLMALAEAGYDVSDALYRVADAIGATESGVRRQVRHVPEAADDALTPETLGAILAEEMPADAIVSDEAATAGPAIFAMTQGALKHDWLTLTGGAIGQGLPVAVGAAVACPDRKVICLQADGSGMYTVQALWTLARESLDVTVIVLKNNAYAILGIELERVGVKRTGAMALSLLSLSDPELDWVALSTGMGVEAERVHDAATFREAVKHALDARGPRLIEANLARAG